MLDVTTDAATSEAFAELKSHVGRKSTTIPVDLLVQHVLDCVPPEEWTTRVAAMDALLRRLDFAHRDELRIDTRPDGQRMLGTYVTRRKGTSSARPYQTVVRGVDPIVARCDCPDFVKNSLGICKHVLTVLEMIHEKPKRWQQALREQEATLSRPLLGLSWDPIRPLAGAGDWLDRVSWNGPSVAKQGSSERRTRALKRFKKSAVDDTLVLARAFHDEPAKRLAVVDDVLALMPAKNASVGGDPALGILLRTERERLRTLVSHVPTLSQIRSAYKGLKRTLYPYQREGIERFLSAGRLLLADDMGLGKTAQAIASVDILHRTGRARRVVIIVPASLKPQWAREWSSFSELPATVADGTPTERQALYRDRSEGILIINYEQLLRDLEVIIAWTPDLVVLDEAQRIKNWATKTANSVKRLTPRFRLVLTGTPMENRVEELASIVEWVDDFAMEPKWRLSAYHSVRADGRKEIVGVRNLDTLRERLRPCMLRRIRQDVLDQLPSRTDTRIPVELTAPQREEHDALIPPIASLMARARKRPLTQAEFLRLMSLLTTQRIISNGLAQLQFEEIWPAIRNCAPEESIIQGLSAPKLLELRQLIRQVVLEQGRKVVIFSQWRRMLALAHWAIGDLFHEQGLRAGFFTGAEGQRRRTQNIVEFHDDPNFRALLASDAGGVGLNLQHAANCVINLEMPWNPAVLEQRIGRIYRLGQKLPIDVYNLVCEEGIESRIAGLVGSKQAFFKGLFDGESDAVQFEQSGSFMSKVELLYGTEAAVGGSAPNDFELAEFPDPELEDDLDEEMSDPFEPILDAADESLQAVPSASPTEPPDTHSSDSESVAFVPTTSPADVRQLFSGVKIRKELDGRVVIEAEPEAASTLYALFEGMASMLQSYANPPDGPRPKG